VRGIPFDFTDAQLEAIFENVGPIKVTVLTSIRFLFWANRQLSDQAQIRPKVE
jgi:hypothetical protein